jgi:oxygen-independent coproporphyrinogen-3 oxidase
VERRGDGLVADELLTAEEEGDEMLLMGLRLAEGIDLDRYSAISGRTLDRAQLNDLVRHGMVERTRDGRLRATRAGFFVLDAVVADLAA